MIKVLTSNVVLKEIREFEVYVEESVIDWMWSMVEIKESRITFRFCV